MYHEEDQEWLLKFLIMYGDSWIEANKVLRVLGTTEDELVGGDLPIEYRKLSGPFEWRITPLGVEIAKKYAEKKANDAG